MVRWETISQHFATSITGQINEYMIHPPLKSNHGKISPFPILEMGSG
jgi:hypothetical protein